MEQYIKTLRCKEICTSNKKSTTKELNPSDWQEFVFENIFNIQRGESLYITDSEVGHTPYASASAENNGISAYIDVQKNDFIRDLKSVELISD